MSKIPRLVRAVNILRERSGNEPRPPASEVDIAEASYWIKKWYGIDLPPELGEFWRLTDGIGIDGTFIYSVHDRREPVSSIGLIDFHDELRAQDLYDDAVAHLMAVGNRDDVFAYLYDTTSGEWKIADPFDWPYVDETFPTFAALLESVYGEMLQDDGIDY